MSVAQGMSLERREWTNGTKWTKWTIMCASTNHPGLSDDRQGQNP